MCKKTPYEAKNRSQFSYHVERYKSLNAITPLALADRVASYLLAIVWSCGVTGVGNKPHNQEYSAYTSTKIKEMTIPLNNEKLNKLKVNIDGSERKLNKKEKGKIRTRPNSIIKITNTETDGTALHWLKNRKMRQLDIQLDCVAAVYIHATWYFSANNLIIIPADVINTLNELGTPNANYKIVHDFTPNMHAEMKILKHLRLKNIDLKGINIGVSKPCCHRCKEVLDNEKVNYTSHHTDFVLEERWSKPF